MNHLAKDSSYDIIDSQSIRNKDNDEKQSRDYLFQKSRSSLAVPACVKHNLSSTTGVPEKSSSQSHQATRSVVSFDAFKNSDIKSMSYSERFKAFFSNATYNIKTFSKGSWRNVKINKEPEFESARLFDEDFNYDEAMPAISENLFNLAHQRIIWFSYRKNFPMIRSSDNNESQSASSDFGWGCMIRCSQMLLAETLKRHYAAEQEFQIGLNEYDEKKGFLKSIIKLFLDCPSSSSSCQSLILNADSERGDFALFGIQRICQHALLKQYQNTVKTWYTSIQVSVVLQEILEECQEELTSRVGLSIVNFSDQIIFLKELQNATMSPAGRQVKSPRSLLILIHMKFGVSKFLPEYIPYLIALMRIPNFIGALTGTDTKGMYIVGYQGTHAIVLDPHFVQDSTLGEEGLDNQFSTYFNDTPRSLNFESLSSDISLGFYIDILQLNSIDLFVNKIYEINDQFPDPLISVLVDRVEVSDDLEDEAIAAFSPLLIKYEQPHEDDVCDTTQVFSFQPLNPDDSIPGHDQALDETELKAIDELGNPTITQSSRQILKDLLSPTEFQEIKEKSSDLVLPKIEQGKEREVDVENASLNTCPKPEISKKYVSPWGGPDVDLLASNESDQYEYKKKNRANSDFEVLF